MNFCKVPSSLPTLLPATSKKKSNPQCWQFRTIKHIHNLGKLSTGTAKMTLRSGPWSCDVLSLLQQCILGCRRERKTIHTNKVASCSPCDAGRSLKSLQCCLSRHVNMAVQVLQLQFSCSPLGCNPCQENSCGNSVVYP